MQTARHALTLIVLAALLAAPAAEAKRPSVSGAAKAELRDYRSDHGWVGSTSLLTCKRDRGRVVCGASIKGRKAGEDVTCAATVVVTSTSKRRTAKIRLGKCEPNSTGPVSLHVHLDPTYTRDPLDPFKVTYSYSASATSGAKPVPLPPGVLAFYSDGTLECAVNVGGAVRGSSCPIRYGQLGAHRVTIIYSSGTESATLTKVEDIKPLPTETTLQVSYANLPGGPEALAVSQRCNWQDYECGFVCNWQDTPGAGSEKCFFKQEWILGTLTVKASSSPAGKAFVQCIGPQCVGGDLQIPLNGELKIKVAMYANGVGVRYPIGTGTPPTCQFMKENAEWWGADVTQTGYTATHAAAGYVGAPVTKAISISPSLPC